jgi:phosphatidylglycerol lysyltransferase
MKKNIVQLLSLAIFAVALWILQHELKAYHYHDIVRQMKILPPWRLLAAFGLTVCSYVAMIGYDLLAVRYVGRILRYVQVALTAFISYAFSNTLSHPLITGAIRYRLYSVLGLSAIEITQIIVFCAVTLWLGVFFLGGLVFVIAPLEIPSSFHLPFLSVQGLGVVFLFVAGSYLAGVLLYKRRVNFRNWELTLPSPPIAVFQILFSSLDWAFASGTLYVLLPATPELSYPKFLGIFLLAQILGLISQIPGGIGVFETLIILLVKPILPTDAVLGSLVVYRAIYYLFPLAIGIISLSVQEIRQRQLALKRTVDILSQWISPIIPLVFAITTFIGGIILLFSGATPSVHSRLAWLKDVLPLPVIELSHLLGSIAGVGLLILARGLQRRLDGAYMLTLILLGAGSFFSLLKGGDYEEALILFAMLIALWLSRDQFYRQTSLMNQRFTSGWMIAVGGVVACSIWLGFFTHKHMAYSHELWWQFSIHGDAPRFLRASVGAITVILILALVQLFRPAVPKFVHPTPTELEHIRLIVRESPRASAHLALLGDKQFLLSSTNKAFIMYGVEGKSWVAVDDPFGPEEEYPELVWRFRELCDRHDGWPVFHEVSARHLPLYIDQGLTLLKIGEDARVPLANFSFEGSEHRSQRHTVRKLEKEGSTFEILSQEVVPSFLPELRRISDEWLTRKNTSEKRFSLGFFNPEYLVQTPLGIVRQNGKIVAFTNIWLGGQKEELSVDLMRYSSDAPSNVMEYLFVQLMLWGRQEGYTWFSLGMAPLSGIENRIAAPLWNRMGALLFQHGEHFYNFQGLRQYKEKFDPVWKPKYLACPGGLALPRVLANLASLISGGMKGVLTK